MADETGERPVPPQPGQYAPVPGPGAPSPEPGRFPFVPDPGTPPPPGPAAPPSAAPKLGYHVYQDDHGAGQERKKTAIWFVIAAIAAVVLVAAILGIWAVTYLPGLPGSPLYDETREVRRAIADLDRAVDTRNLPLFERHFDIERVSDGLAADAGMTPEEAAPVKKEYAKQVRDSVELGRDSGSMSLFSSYDGFVGAIRRVDRSANAATVTAAVDEQGGKEQLAVFRMEKRPNGDWAVVLVISNDSSEPTLTAQ